MGPQEPLILYGVKHPYRIREIAARAGLSQATVDRVLHRRGGVREGTARAVHQAIADLDREQPGTGRDLVIDVVLRTSRRFAAAVRAALDAEIGEFAPLTVRTRVHHTDAPAEALNRVDEARSHGLIVLAQPDPDVTDAAARLTVPVVTLNHDLPAGKRIAHVGVDDFGSGATAAYLVDRLLADRAGDVLLINGRGPREEGFRSGLPVRRLLTAGSADTGPVREILAANPSIRAVYSAGTGGSAAVLAAFAAERRNYDVFVAHGLDNENTELLRACRISAVLHQDLRADLRHACRAILRSHGALPGAIRSQPSVVQVITPFNVPVTDG